ncbi:uncharacterized protein [Apostichopus japonicus]|uniref:uncharacterized protein n=1 Tax=Stichopus japonicus TaxID=307972 RepID=UPI003AB5CFFF
MIVWCIIQHTSFQSVCLDIYVIETAYHDYRQQHGQLQEEDLHMQLVRWCWGYLGKKHRVTIPACAVTKIRGCFPSAEYVGFQYPELD